MAGFLPNPNANTDGKDTPDRATPNMRLVGYCIPKVERGRDARDAMYGQRWKEYTRLWRGFWSDEDKNTNSERSRLISPALSQAIEMTVAEIEEAVFSRTAWFDIDDDLTDEQKDDAVAYRDLLLEDFEWANAPASISECFLLGAIYGTGIAKLHVKQKTIKTPGPDGRTKTETRVIVVPEAVRPDEFVIDASATNITDAHFVAHEMIRPMNTIKEKQASGFYNKGHIAPWQGRKASTTGTEGDANADAQDDGVKITEYCGLVPGAVFGKGGMVEAIVTIANENFVLRAVENPYTNKDRPYVAYQHDTIPGAFWGRSVSEKGYNPQKALDSELRARFDALALTTAPMMGVDITRMPHNPDLRVRPGRIFQTRGRPSEVMEPVGFQPNGLALTFQQGGDLERMVQMGTGAMDSATPLGTARRNETVGGISAIQSGFLKRAKRTMQNIERQFLDPLITKSLWRYMQFEPQRYPVDMKFHVKSAMGIMAKEVENQQLVQMLGFVPPESPAHSVIIQALFDNTNSSEKSEIKKAMQAMSAPPSPEEQQMAQMQQQMALQMAQLELAKTQAEVEKIKAEAALAAARAQYENVKADLEDDKVEIDAANAAINAQNSRNRAEELNVKKAEARKTD